MKKIIALFLIIIAGNHCIAQTTFLTKTQGINTFNLPHDLLIKPDNNILYLNNSIDPNTFIYANEIYEVSPEGAILQVKTFVDSTSLYETYTHIFNVEDTIYTLGWGEATGISPSLYFILNKLDLQLNLIESHKMKADLPNYNYNGGMTVGQAYYLDSTFVYISSTGHNSHIPFLVEISKNGEIIRTENDEVSFFHHLPYDFIQRPQGLGFYVFMFNNNVPGQIPGGYMYTYDNQLNVENYIPLPNDYFFYFTAIPFSTTSFYLSGTWLEWTSNEPWRAGLVKMRTDGTVINEFLYDVPADSASNTAYRNAIDTLSDGSIILCSINNIIIQLIPQLEPTYINLFKLSPNLELQWQRYIGGDGKYDAFAMRVTPDDEIVILGTFSETPPPSWHYMEPMFIKTDSYGLFTGINDEYLNLKSTEAILYPNPARDILNVEFSMLYKKATFILTDISGKTALVKQLTANWQTVDISSIPAGTYVYRIFNKKGLDERGKVLVE